MSVGVYGLGLLGRFGVGYGDFLAALETGAPALPREVSTDLLKEYLPPRSLRRIDHYARLALSSALLALEDRGVLEEERSRLGVVIGSGYGAMRTTFAFLDSVIEDGDSCASPISFSNSVHNAAGAHLSILLKATGPSLTVSQFEMSAISGLISAMGWLEEGRVDRVLFGLVDEGSEVLDYCHERLFAGEVGAPSPGEGCVFFLLERVCEENPPYGTILEVDLCRGGKPTFPLKEGTVVIAGDEGYGRCATRYARLLPEKVSVTSCADRYGSFPVSHGFDLAAGCAMVREGKVFGPGDSFAKGWRGRSPLVRAAGEPLEGRSVACVKLGEGKMRGTFVVGG